MMRSTSLAAVLSAAIALSAAAPSSAQDRRPKLVAETEPLSPQEQREKFHLPPGFRIELIAAEPQVQKPINLNFDAAGRLYVSGSVEYPYPAGPGDTPRDEIKVIADGDGDGVPDKVQTFASGLNIPIGIAPVSDGALGYSIPDIWHFADADGDGKSDRRAVYYGRFGFGDTHGMANSFTWWIDGWVYACHGFSNTSTVKGSDGKPVTMQSGNTYRLRPDGSHVEQYTWGQVNPFGLCFDPLGNVYTADCHSKPAYLLLRGAYYPSFGKPHDGLGFGPAIMQHNHGSTGIAGVAFYAADQFPEKYRGTLFIGNPVTGRINHDRLQWHGSSPTAVELPDFLRCDDPWFRPVDIQLGPDGALYVADFYNRIIGHYEVPLNHPGRDRHRGRIWRISYVGNRNAQDDGAATGVPDLTQASIAELLAHLDDANLTVRTHATHQLVHRVGEKAVEPVRALLQGDSTARQKAHGLWVLFRLDALEDRVIEQLAHSEHRLVRVHLAKALAEMPQWNEPQRRLVAAMTGDPEAFVRRAAADALGRHPHADNIEPLLKLWANTPPSDPQLVHTARMALRDTLRSLGNLPEVASTYHDSADDLARLIDVSHGIRTPQSARFLLAHYENHEPKGGRLGPVLHHIVRYVDELNLPRAHRLAASYKDQSPGVQQAVLLTVNRALRERGERLPQDFLDWARRLAADELAAGDEGRVRNGLQLVREFRLSGLLPMVAEHSGQTARFQNLRPDAWNTLAVLDRDRAVALLAGILASLQEPMATRQRAAGVLGGLNAPSSRAALLKALQRAPSGLAVAIGRALVRSREGAAALLAAIEQGKASRRLLQDLALIRGLRAIDLPDREARITKLLNGLPPADQKLRELIARRRATFSGAAVDVARGALLFEKNCAACHRLGPKGTKVGPELDGVGQRGLDRLLEDILDPNRNVDAAFRASVIVTKGGQVVTGLVQREEGETLLVVDQEGKERQIALGDIQQRRKLQLSPMPANVQENLSESEFYDLVGFLLQQKKPPKAPEP